MSDLPDALKYGASHSTIRTNRFRLVPQGSDTGNPNGVFRVRLPEKSLVRLSSLSAYCNATLSGMVGGSATNWANAKMPASYKFFRAVRFYVGGAVASGGLSQNYDQLYDALLKCSADKAWVDSRFNEGYRELITASDDTVQPPVSLNGATSSGSDPSGNIVPTKMQYLTCSDFLGLPRCNGGGGVIDTSLYNSVEVEFILNDESCITKSSAGTYINADSITYTLTNFRVDVDCVTSVSPMYVEMMALRLQDASPIRFPYQNFVTVIAQNTGSNRIQVNSQSVDMMLVAPLRNAWANTKAMVSTQMANQLSSNRYQYDSKIGTTGGASSAQNSYINAEAGITMQLVVGSDVYPKQQITHALVVPDLTINTLYHGSLQSKNLFSTGLLNEAPALSRSYGLSDNLIWINNFSLESEGWATKKLTGIDTSAQNVDMILNTTGFGAVAEGAPNSATGNFWLLGALVTSQLIYDPATASVSIVA